MAKQMVEVDVPDGWEVVAYRRPVTGEHYLTGCGVNCVAEGNSHASPWIIVRKAWEWPAWIRAKWMWRGLNGRWFLSDDEPVDQGDYCTVHSAHYSGIPINYIDFSPPPDRPIKRLNPRFST